MLLTPHPDSAGALATGLLEDLWVGLIWAAIGAVIQVVGRILGRLIR